MPWEKQEAIVDAWDAFINSDRSAQKFQTGSHGETLIKRRERLVDLGVSLEHVTWETVQSDEGEFWSQCIWHDPLALSIVQCDDNGKQALRARGLLEATVDALKDGMPPAALSFRVQEFVWSMSYPALMALMLSSQKDPLVSIKDNGPTNYWEIERKPGWKAALEGSLFGQYAEFWTTDLGGAMDALLMTGGASNQNCLTALRLMDEMGGVASEALIETALEKWNTGSFQSDRAIALLERLKVHAAEHRLDSRWPQSTTAAPKPRM